MSKRLAIINIIIAVADALICLAAITMFAYAAIHFGKWWITLFSFIPLLLFSSHTLIVDADLDAAKEGGENDS